MRSILKSLKKIWLPVLGICIGVILSGCVVGESVTVGTPKNGPLVPRDPKILKTELTGDNDLGVVCQAGSVWHLTLTDEQRQINHWLVLYPNGQSITSLGDERGWRVYDDSPSTSKKIGAGIEGFVENVLVAPFGGEEEVARQKAELKSHKDFYLNLYTKENNERLALIQSKDTARLLRSIEDYSLLPKVGRFAFHDGLLYINILELHRQEGVGLVNWSTTGVSQFVFRPVGPNAWELDAEQTRTIWWAPNDKVARIFRQEQLCAYSTRGRTVRIQKVEGFVPPVLPEGWDW